MTKGKQVHYKGTNTLRTLLGNPKDKDPKANKTGIIYHYKCPPINCPEVYKGESGRDLGERVKEHLKAPPPSTNTVPQQDIHWIQNNSILYTRRLTVIPGPSRNPYSSAYMTLHSTGTWGNTNYCIYWTTCYRHHQQYSSILPASPTPPYHTTPLPTTYVGGTNFSFLGKYLMQEFQTPPQTPLIPPLHPKHFPLQQHHLGKFHNFYLLV